MATYKCALLLTIILLSSCSETGTPSTKTPDTSANSLSFDFTNSTNIPVPDNSDMHSYNVLVFGNSHINGISQQMQLFMNATMPSKKGEFLSASSQLYLEERLYDGTSVNLLKSSNWSHVIFQGQKYSQSGSVNYPTHGTKKWLQLAKEQNATTILFPEHPQDGNLEEGVMVHRIHVGIARQESSCVAPIGLAWDKALALRPELDLHHVDGNHASTKGQFLTALVFFQIITGYAADLVPYVENSEVDSITQDFLGQIASQTIAENPACDY